MALSLDQVPILPVYNQIPLEFQRTSFKKRNQLAVEVNEDELK